MYGSIKLQNNSHLMKRTATFIIMLKKIPFITFHISWHKVKKKLGKLKFQIRNSILQTSAKI